MVVTKIEPVTKTKFKIYVDEQFAFVLYKGELSRYRIKEDGEIEEETYIMIREEVVLKRAKLRAMHLLTDMGRTEKQLRDKLLAGAYPPDIVDEAVVYVKSFGYINDKMYAVNFINGRKNRKSKREIYTALLQKGISKDIAEEAMATSYQEEDSRDAIKVLLEKKRFDPAKADYSQKQKIMAYLLRKGFSYEDIRQVIQVSEWNA